MVHHFFYVVVVVVVPIPISLSNDDNGTSYINEWDNCIALGRFYCERQVRTQTHVRIIRLQPKKYFPLCNANFKTVSKHFAHSLCVCVCVSLSFSQYTQTQSKAPWKALLYNSHECNKHKHIAFFQKKKTRAHTHNTMQTMQHLRHEDVLMLLVMFCSLYFCCMYFFLFFSKCTLLFKAYIYPSLIDNMLFRSSFRMHFGGKARAKPNYAKYLHCTKKAWCVRVCECVTQQTVLIISPSNNNKNLYVHVPVVLYACIFQLLAFHLWKNTTANKPISW